MKTLEEGEAIGFALVMKPKEEDKERAARFANRGSILVEEVQRHSE